MRRALIIAALFAATPAWAYRPMPVDDMIAEILINAEHGQGACAGVIESERLPDTPELVLRGRVTCSNSTWLIGNVKGRKGNNFVAVRQ